MLRPVSEGALQGDGPPITAGEFQSLMTAVGPFEADPRVAVGVSGGADSLALCLLTHDWARARGGSTLALTVDHGLRPESAAEAAQVGRWLAARGVAHAILSWGGVKPRTGIQATARDARMRLLMERCRADGIFHLLLAHNLEDQAETVLLRLSKGSGVDGLAAMATVRETADVRILRPLLSVARGRLRATCRTLAQPWIDDPSNRMATFARPRLRAVTDALGREGLTPRSLAATARRAGHARVVLERATAVLIADMVTLHPEGYVRLVLQRLREAETEIGLRALVRCLKTIGNCEPLRLERVERLHHLLLDGPGTRDVTARTLGGCLVRVTGRHAVICREPAAIRDRIRISAGETVRWDDRFEVRLERDVGDGPLFVSALGDTAAARALPQARGADLPAAVRMGLPAIWDANRPVAVPNFEAALWEGRARQGAPVATAAFRPAEPVSGPSFAVV